MVYGIKDFYVNVNIVVVFSSFICFGVCTVCGVVYKGRVVFVLGTWWILVVCYRWR